MRTVLMSGILIMVCALAWKAGYHAHAIDASAARWTAAGCAALPPATDISADAWPTEEE